MGPRGGNFDVNMLLACVENFTPYRMGWGNLNKLSRSHGVAAKSYETRQHLVMCGRCGLRRKAFESFVLCLKIIIRFCLWHIRSSKRIFNSEFFIIIIIILFFPLFIFVCTYIP